MKISLFGANGFIGTAILASARARGVEVIVYNRTDLVPSGKSLGHVIYAAGAGNCVDDYLNVLEANCTKLSKIISQNNYDSFVYLSSTRVCMDAEETKEYADTISRYSDNRRLFNLTKQVSEELLRRDNRPHLIIRPSNVYGLALKSDLFLPSIIRDALVTGMVSMHVTPFYSKDYVKVDDLVDAIFELMRANCRGTYNIAYGKNITASQIANVLQEETGCKISWLSKENAEEFKEIDISLVRGDISFNPSYMLNDLKAMIKDYKQKLGV